MHSEKESLSGWRLSKNHSWRIAETLKNIYQTAPTSPHVVWEGFKINNPSSFKNKLQHMQLSDTTGTSNRIGFYSQMKQKKEHFGTLNGLVNTGIQSTSCVQWNMLLYFWCCGLYFCWRSWTSCLDTWHHGFFQIPIDKKKSITDRLC